jgi:hypothetical protein
MQPSVLQRLVSYQRPIISATHLPVSCTVLTHRSMKRSTSERKRVVMLFRAMSFSGTGARLNRIGILKEGTLMRNLSFIYASDPSVSADTRPTVLPEIADRNRRFRPLLILKYLRHVRVFYTLLHIEDIEVHSSLSSSVLRSGSRQDAAPLCLVDSFTFPSPGTSNPLKSIFRHG